MTHKLSSQLGNDFHQSLQQLGTAGRRVARFIDQNRQIVLASSAAAIGNRTCTSDATVVRTVQALGFVGLGDLKRAILESMVPTSTPADDMRRTLVDLAKSSEQAFDGVLHAHDDGLKVLSSNECRAQIAAGALALEHSERIAVFGIGPSAALATYVSTMLARIGRRSRAINATGSMLADQLLDLRHGDSFLILAYGRPYKEVTAVFREAKILDLRTVLVTEATNTALAKMADVVIVIPRGRPGHVSLHGATLVGLEALILSLAAARPDVALTSLEKLNDRRRSIRS